MNLYTGKKGRKERREGGKERERREFWSEGEVVRVPLQNLVIGFGLKTKTTALKTQRQHTEQGTRLDSALGERVARAPVI